MPGCGRAAVRVEVTRAGLSSQAVPSRFWAGRAEVMVDAELGILLRVTWQADGTGPEVTGLASLEADPVIDPALFAPPPGSLIAVSMTEMLGAGGVCWRALKTVAGVAAGGLGRLDQVRAVRPAAGSGAGWGGPGPDPGGRPGTATVAGRTRRDRLRPAVAVDVPGRVTAHPGTGSQPS